MALILNVYQMKRMSELMTLLCNRLDYIGNIVWSNASARNQWKCTKLLMGFKWIPRHLNERLDNCKLHFVIFFLRNVPTMAPGRIQTMHKTSNQKKCAEDPSESVLKVCFHFHWGRIFVGRIPCRFHHLVSKIGKACNFRPIHGITH